MNFKEAYALGLNSRNSENEMRHWEYQVKMFLKMAQESEVLSGKWKMAHLMLSRLGVDHDNCEYCGTAAPYEREDKK